MLTTERWLQDQVRKLATDLGLVVQHLEDSRRSWLPGWPDLVILGHGEILWRELKTDDGHPTREQRHAGYLIQAAGGNWSVWRPADLLSGRITRELTAITSYRLERKPHVPAEAQPAPVRDELSPP